jgi:sulfite reductase alpha subunit-like flavoprotein
VDYVTPSLKTGDGTEVGLRRIHGVATGSLEAFSSQFVSSKSPPSSEQPSLKIFPKPTQDFALPSELSTPLILIGPGTGIAPFMGFLAHRKALIATSSNSGSVGTVTVFSGCRHQHHDWLYHKELQSMKDEGIITNLYSAFSRDGTKKVYVQDIMKNNPECSKHLVDTIVNGNGRVYICGDGNRMARDVQNVLAELIGTHIDSTKIEEHGKSYIENMKNEGRFLLDIWS